MVYIDDYMYKVLECTPDTILDEREKFDEFECFTVKELEKIKQLYQSIASNNMEVAQYSLDIMEQKVYPYLKEKLVNCPNIGDFISYDIRCDGCWGITK